MNQLVYDHKHATVVVWYIIVLQEMAPAGGSDRVPGTGEGDEDFKQ